MSTLAQPDVAGLAMLARHGDRELRPVLLTLQTRQFVAAPHRDRHMAATYESLALGLIPLVPDDVVAEVAAMLKRVPEPPARVMAMLRQRRSAHSLYDPIRLASGETLDPHDIADLVALARPEVDRALAANGGTVLDAQAVDALVGRAVEDAELARALLARPEPGILQRAALFRFAAEWERDRIRVELERAIAVSAPARAILTDARRARLFKLAQAAKFEALRAELGKALRIDPAPAWRVDDPAGAELFALSLAAVGLDGEDCISILLSADRQVAASVPTVFRLAHICRTTSPAVAARLVGAGTAAPAKRAPRRATASRPRQADGARAAASASEALAPRPARGRSASAPAGRRSRSTTGRDRT
jgi:hypothetical protein